MNDEKNQKRPKSYQEAGVDLEEAERTVKKITGLVASTHNANVLESIGPFASLYRFPLESYEEPVLVASTDGVGTKILLHLEAGTFREAGIDLVAMSSNDILTAGARPLFFLDYIAAGKLSAEAVAGFIEGMAEACMTIGASLIGGETAEMPGVYRPGDYDLSGFIVGVVDRKKIPDIRSISPGDVVIGLASSGPHANGYSLIRKVLKENQLKLDQIPPEIGISLKDALLAPTVLYHPVLIDLYEQGIIKGSANITGGGFYENIPRTLPEGTAAVIKQSSIKVPEIFRFLQAAGDIPEDEMFHVFNMGIGFVVIVSPQSVATVMNHIESKGLKACIIGEVIRGEREVVIS